MEEFESNQKSQTKAEIPPQKAHEWWAEFCKASAIHGMPYLARRDLHWSERIFWVAVIVAAAANSIHSCINQWERFRNNPIVYEYEYLFALRNFTFMGITLCIDYDTEQQVNALISDLWGVNAADEKAAYFRRFLYVLNRLHYNNLEILEPFENDTRLEQLNYLEILLQLQQDVLPNRNETDGNFAASITEMGLCQTTTQLSRYGNPFGKIETLNVTAIRQCGYFYECQLKLMPANSLDRRMSVYLHDVNELMLPQDPSTVYFDLGTSSSYELQLLVSPISAEQAVQNLPIAYRKCRYYHENNLKYFSPYHPSLCRLECRIKAALSLCNCKPYFYAGGPQQPICNITGMLCLQRKKWLNQTCQCMPLCVQYSYILTERYAQSGTEGPNYSGNQFERTIVLNLRLPKMGVKRRVVFSTEQLVMSFGGAIGLFLGASCMTIYGLVYLALYFLTVKCGCSHKLQPEQANDDKDQQKTLTHGHT